MASLDELGVRIERLVTDPDSISAPLTRLVRPLLKRMGYQPQVAIVATKALLEALEKGEALDDKLGAAHSELEANVDSVERTTVVNKRVMVAHAAWLRRLYEVLVKIDRVVKEPNDDAVRDIANATDGVRLLPPLTVTGKTIDEIVEPELDHAAAIDVELAAIDRLLDAAADETSLLGHRRRLLEAARQLLLDTTAALPIEAAGAADRQRYVAREISRLDRLEAAGVAPDVDLVHQMRESLAQGNRDRLHAALVAMHGFAAARGDTALVGPARKAIRRMWGGRDPSSAPARSQSLRRSVDEIFGGDFSKVVKTAYQTGRSRYSDEEMLKGVARSYFTDAGEQSALSAMLATDGCFEVGGTLVPTRIIEEEKRARAVRYPTQDMVLLPATDPSDIPDAIVEDPRSIILDLAAGRLLARRFVKEEVIQRKKTIHRGEVRVYVLDGSGSMIGPRARMRDAILTSELATLRTRLLERAKTTRVVLYFRYFDLVVGPITRVDSIASAEAAIHLVLSTIRQGGTDIHAALLSSFAAVRAHRDTDPDLALAQIVLITDGEAPVFEPEIEAARSGIGDLPIALSVIALGQENEALRGLVAHQRARGGRAFYHLISDAMLAEVSNDELDQGMAIHPPPVTSDASSKEALSRDFADVVEDMARLTRQREIEAFEAAETESAARQEVGIDENALDAGEKARALALYKDHRALEQAFLRWFPMPVTAAKHERPADNDLDSVQVVLSTVAEVVSTVGGTALARKADAIDLLERLLPDARLSPARYLQTIAKHAPYLHDALESVHSATTPATRVVRSDA